MRKNNVKIEGIVETGKTAKSKRLRWVAICISACVALIAVAITFITGLFTTPAKNPWDDPVYHMHAQVGGGRQS